MKASYLLMYVICLHHIEHCTLFLLVMVHNQEIITIYTEHVCRAVNHLYKTSNERELLYLIGFLKRNKCHYEIVQN